MPKTPVFSFSEYDSFLQRIRNSNLLSSGEKRLMLFFSRDSRSVEGNNLLSTLAFSEYPELSDAYKIHSALSSLIEKGLLVLTSTDLVMGQYGWHIKVYLAVSEDWKERV